MPLGPFRVEYVRYTSEIPQKKGHKQKARLLNPPKKFDVSVAGVSYRQAEIVYVAKALSRSGVRQIFEAELVYENKNKHDKHAVACYILGEHVGYLPRDLCVEFRTAMRPVIPSGLPDIPLFCPGLFVGGRQGDYIGIRLDLPRSRKAAVARERKAKAPLGEDLINDTVN